MDTFLLLTSAVVIAFIVGAAVLPNMRGATAGRGDRGGKGGRGAAERRREPRVRAGEAPPYQRRLLMTRAEKDFYRALVAAMGGDGVVFAQVPMASVVRVAPDTPARQGWQNRIDRKTVDFLVCDPLNLDPIVAIELDDSSHAEARRVERDAFVNGAFEAAGVALVRVPVRRSYVPAEIRAMVLGAQGAS